MTDDGIRERVAEIKSHLFGGIDEQLFPELADMERRYEATIAVLQADIQFLLDTAGAERDAALEECAKWCEEQGYVAACVDDNATGIRLELEWKRIARQIRALAAKGAADGTEG